MAKPLKRPRGWEEERGPRGEKLWVRKVVNYRIYFQPTTLEGVIVPLKEWGMRPWCEVHFNKKGEYFGLEYHVKVVLNVLDDLSDLILCHFDAKYAAAMKETAGV